MIAVVFVMKTHERTNCRSKNLSRISSDAPYRPSERAYTI